MSMKNIRFRKFIALLTVMCIACLSFNIPIFRNHKAAYAADEYPVVYVGHHPRRPTLTGAVHLAESVLEGQRAHGGRWCHRRRSHRFQRVVWLQPHLVALPHRLHRRPTGFGTHLLRPSHPQRGARRVCHRPHLCAGGAASLSGHAPRLPALLRISAQRVDNWKLLLTFAPICQTF